MSMNRIPTTPSVVIVLSLAGIILLGVADFFTGWEFGFFVFYFIPISYTAWYCSRNASIAVSLVSGAAWFAADYLLAHHYSSVLFAFWNTLIRLVSFLIISFSIANIRYLLLSERRKSSQLREALSQVKTLRGLLPICASCKKIRNDEGYWEQIESYFHDRSEVDFTHGLCEECVRKLYPEIMDDAPSESKGSA